MARLTSVRGEVRVARIEDVPAMHAIRLAVRENVLSDPSKIRPSDYGPYLTTRGRGWVHLLDGTITGFAIADADSRSIWALFVDPKFERHGVGRRLHDVMVDWLFRSGSGTVWLTTEPGTRAARMYASLGWRHVGETASGEWRFERSGFTTFQMSQMDRGLQTEFERGSLPTSEFTHRAHVVVSVTRLRLRSWRFLLPFAWEARRARLQAEQSPGCRGALVRKTQGLAFWTLTYWDDEASLRQFMLNSPHRKAMPKLARWCDESAVTHWTHDSDALPGWDVATARLAEHGRLSRVEYPSELQRSGRVGVS